MQAKLNYSMKPNQRRTIEPLVSPRMPLRKEAFPLLADADRIPGIREALAES
jgi:hypothetical protein